MTIGNDFVDTLQSSLKVNCQVKTFWSSIKWKSFVTSFDIHLYTKFYYYCCCYYYINKYC